MKYKNALIRPFGNVIEMCPTGHNAFRCLVNELLKVTGSILTICKIISLPLVLGSS